jgi:DNA-binding GntR family transcriptional regulator
VAIAIDEYVLDTLMRDLVAHDRKPSAFLVYLHLYRKTIGEARPSVHQSHQQIADATGLSKSAVQAAVRVLARRRLIQARLASPTTTPEYVVHRPWRDR